jgi:virginiamycin B lyase
LESQAEAQDETTLLGRIGPGGHFSEIALPPGTFAEELVAGPDGHLWVARLDEIDRVSPFGAITRYRGIREPAALTTGPGRTIWFAENGPRIGRIKPGGGVKYFSVPARGFLHDMTEGPDGNLWYTNWRHRGSPTIGRMTPRGRITEFPLHNLGRDRGSIPDEIVAGPDGNLWFTAHRPPHLGRVTPRGKIRQWRLPEFRGPSDIAVGPHGNLWFPEPRVDPMTLGIWAPRFP